MRFPWRFRMPAFWTLAVAVHRSLGVTVAESPPHLLLNRPTRMT